VAFPQTHVRFSCVCSEITCRFKCSARAKLFEQPGTPQTCVRSRASSGSGTRRPRLFLIRCGTGTGGGMRLRCAACSALRFGEGTMMMTGPVLALGGDGVLRSEVGSNFFAAPTSSIPGTAAERTGAADTTDVPPPLSSRT
jgi:hypothetical protein